VPSGYATRRRWRETLGDDVVLRMNAARSPRAVGGASDVDCEERHTKRGRWSQSSPKVSRSRGPFRCGRSHRSVCTSPKTRCTSAACGCRSGDLRNCVLVATGHGLKTRPSQGICAAFGRAVSCTIRRSVQAHDVRRSCARQEVCGLPTRMLCIALDRHVS
jgi:hypothetical protein